MRLTTIQELVVFEDGSPLYRQIYELLFMVVQSMRLPNIQESGDGPPLYLQIYDLVSMVENITTTCQPTIHELVVFEDGYSKVAMYNVGNFACGGAIEKEGGFIRRWAWACLEYGEKRALPTPSIKDACASHLPSSAGL
ncbi:2646_t:CDS:2 [Funneliformis geosporum]|nr:2646_t:CDS:2 [Funneliformis geosporum]